MKHIYQSFEVLQEFRDFACDSSNSEKRKRLKKANSIEGKFDTWTERLHSGIQNLRASLLTKGYEILESSEVLFGVPASIIIGFDILAQNTKSDFYSESVKFGLPYRSGPLFFSVISSNSPE